MGYSHLLYAWVAERVAICNGSTKKICYLLVVPVYEPLFSTSCCPFPRDFPLYKGTRKGWWFWWGFIFWPCTLTNPDLHVVSSHIFKFLKESWFALFFFFPFPCVSLKERKASRALPTDSTSKNMKTRHIAIRIPDLYSLLKNRTQWDWLLPSDWARKPETLFIFLKYFYVLLRLCNW